MDRESAKKLWPIIKAFGEGEAIQIDAAGTWIPVGDCPSFECGAGKYRIKPKPRKVTIAYVPGSTWVWISWDNTRPSTFDVPAGVSIRDVKFIDVELPE
jgi:hypothetical protein